MSLEEVVLAEPRGFCAGVDRAIEIVERALQKFGAPIYVRHEIVHNTYVVDDLKKKGAIFIEDLDDVPAGATLVFSAHGVSQAVRKEAARRGFSLFDATCPLVTKVHVEVAKLAREGYEFIMIGHKGHPEVEGTMGQLERRHPPRRGCRRRRARRRAQGQRLAVVTQTTLSVDDAAEIIAAVKRRFPDVRQPKQQDICYATQNRQDAVKLLAPGVDVVIVVGSPSSSNSNRLRELAQRLGADAYMVDTADDLRAGVVRRQAPRRPDRRRVGARSAGRGGRRAPARARRGVGAQRRRHARACPLPAADGARRQGDARRAELSDRRRDRVATRIDSRPLTHRKLYGRSFPRAEVASRNPSTRGRSWPSAGIAGQRVRGAVARRRLPEQADPPGRRLSGRRRRRRAGAHPGAKAHGLARPGGVRRQPGRASGILGTDYVAKAPPDGYTLAHDEHDPGDRVAPLSQRSLRLDQELRAGVVHRLGAAGAGRQCEGAGALDEGAARALETRPINYASAAIGTVGHLSMEMLKGMAHVDMLHVPYKGTAPATNDLLGGQVDAMMDILPNSMPYVKSGQLRALAVTSIARAPDLPDVPTLAESGLPGYEVQNWYGVLAPAGTPAPIVKPRSTARSPPR